jgi:hypothetical protein
LIKGSDVIRADREEHGHKKTLRPGVGSQGFFIENILSVYRLPETKPEKLCHQRQPRERTCMDFESEIIVNFDNNYWLIPVFEDGIWWIFRYPSSEFSQSVPNRRLFSTGQAGALLRWSAALPACLCRALRLDSGLELPLGHL